MQSVATLLGRLLICCIFVFALAGQISAPQATIESMRSVEMPLPAVGLPIAMALALAGCLSLILGFKARIGAMLLILYLMPASLYFHNFWALEGQEAQQQMIQFLKNAGLAGGLLLIVAHGAGRLSLDARKKRKRAKPAAADE